MIAILFSLLSLALPSLTAIQWSGVYGPRDIPYTMLNGDTFNKALFTTAPQKSTKKNSQEGTTVKIVCSGSLIAANGYASVYFSTESVNDRIIVTFTDDSAWGGYDSTHPLLIIIQGPGIVEFCIPPNNAWILGDAQHPVYMILLAEKESPHTHAMIRTSFPNNTPSSQIKNSLLVIAAGSTIGSATTIPSGTTISDLPTTTLFLNGYHPGTTPIGALGIIIQDGGSIANEMIPVTPYPILTSSDFSWKELWFSAAQDRGKAQIVVTNTHNDIVVLPYQSTVSVSDAQYPYSDYSAVIIENNNTTPLPLRFDPFFPATAAELARPRKGVVISEGGSLCIDRASFLIYTGRTANYAPATVMTKNNQSVASLRKVRNSSALITECHYSIEEIYGQQKRKDIGEKPVPFKKNIPFIQCKESAALYFITTSTNSSATDPLNEGITKTTFSWLVPWYRQGSGILGNGALVFCNEGPCAIIGQGATSSLIGSISNEITLSGGPLLPGGDECIFPLFTHRSDEYDSQEQYGKGCFLYNDDILFANIGILHSDDTHAIAINAGQAPAEATYIGGDTYAIGEFERAMLVKPFGALLPASEGEKYHRRPKMYLWNSAFHITSPVGMATAGFDITLENTIPLLPPSLLPLICTNSCDENNSAIIFYYAGRSSPQAFVAGTLIDGAISGMSSLDSSAHIDIVPHVNELLYCPLHLHIIGKAENFFPTPPPSYEGGATPSALIYLGRKSNITIGKQYLPHETVYPDAMVSVDSGIVSFATEGGLIKNPQQNGALGTGILHIRQGGIFSYYPEAIGTITAPILLETSTGTESNPLLLLPKNIFVLGGITEYDSTESLTSAILVEKGYHLMSVTSNAQDTLLCEQITRIMKLPPLLPFAPYDVTELHTLSVPTIEGTVDRLKIQGALPTAVVRCFEGNIRSIIFDEHPYPPTESPSLIIMGEGHHHAATIGIGPLYHFDSASNTVSTRSLRFLVNDTVTIFLNSDLIWEGTGQVLSYPTTTFQGPTTLKITASDQKTITVPPGSVFDLTHLAPSSVVILENVTLALAAGATIALDHQVTLQIGHNAKIITMPSPSPQQLPALLEESVSLEGNGTLLLNDNGCVSIPLDTTFWIHSSRDQSSTITIAITESGTWNIGTATQCGGTLLIGDTTNTLPHSGSVTIMVEGAYATFTLGKHGYIGFGRNGTLPLFTMTNLSLLLFNGTIDFNASLEEGSCIAINGDAPYAYTWKHSATEERNECAHGRGVVRGGSTVLLYEKEMREKGVIQSNALSYFNKTPGCLREISGRTFFTVLTKNEEAPEEFYYATVTPYGRRQIGIHYDNCKKKTMQKNKKKDGEEESSFIIIPRFSFPNNNHSVALENGFAILYQNSDDGFPTIFPG